MYSAHKLCCTSMRHFTSFHAKLNKYASREGRMMQKLMKGSLSKKKNWYKAEKTASLVPTPTRVNFHQGSQVTKRISVLNKLFMKHVTDLMATGEVADEVLGHGISISRVKVSSDYSVVKVYWLTRGTECDVKVEQILSNAAHSLRHELSRLRVMGVVPRIEFAKDKQYSIIAEVDQLLAKADFGDDFEPEDPTSFLKSEFTLTGSLLPNIQNRIKQLDNDLPEEDVEDPLPPMRMDVLGLDQADIMNKINKSVTKSAALHRQASDFLQRDTPPDAEKKLQDSNNVRDHITANQQKIDLTKFIQKRRILKQKILRGQKNYQPDRELLESELVEDSRMLDNWSEMEEEDFLEELEDKHKV